jgi:hypothetical protein
VKVRQNFVVQKGVVSDHFLKIIHFRTSLKFLTRRFF